MPSIINSDDGVVSGTSGLKSTGGNDGLLNIQSNGSTVVAVTGSGISVTGTVSQTGVSTFAAGTVSAPSITFTGDTNTGIFSPAADTIAFTEGGVESMRIDSSGNVGIGATPSAWGSDYKGSLDIGNFGGLSSFVTNRQVYLSNNAYITNTDGIYKSTGHASFYRMDNSGGHVWYSAPSGTAGTAVSSTQVLQINSGVSLALQGATSQSGTGITFPATQSASTDANTLDDYEEGTWTPTLTGSTTAGTTVYADQYGRYTKIGNQVTVQYYLAVSSATGTGNVGITGLPFAASATNQGAGALMTENLNWDVTTASIVTYMGNSSSLLRVYLSSDNVAWQSQQMVNEAQNYIGTHTYFV